MKKRCSFVYTLFCIFFLLEVMLVSAAETIFEDSIAEEETVEIDTIAFTAYGYADYTGVRLSSNKYGSIIIDEEGGSISLGPYTFTLGSISEGDDDMVYFALTVTKEEGAVTMHRSVSEYNPTISELVTVTVTLENEGSDSAKVAYAEDLPSEVSLVGVPEITKGSSTQTQKSGIADVSWNGVLYNGESATITYLVRVNRYPSDGATIDFADVAFTYEDDYGEYSGSVDPLTLTLLDPLTMAITLKDDEGDIAVGNELEYVITLQNDVGKTMTIDSFVFTVSEGLEITSIESALKETDKAYSWSGKLQAGEEVLFSVFLIPTIGGTHELTGTATYWYESADKTQETSTSSSFTIDVGAVVPKITLNSATYDGGEEIIISYTINNSDTSVSYSNEEVTISSDLFDTLHYVVSLPAKTITLIKKQNFTTPYSYTTLAYLVRMKGTYSGSTYEEDATVIINPTFFSVPYAVAYTVDAVDEEYTNVTMTLQLVTTLAEKPSKLAVVHTEEVSDYKKTISLTTEQIDTLFQQQTVSRSWSIPTAAFAGDEVTLETQLQYVVGTATYYKSESVTLPVYEEVSEIDEEELVAEEVNETAVLNRTAEAEGIANGTEADEETEKELVITGEKEQTTKKWIFFFMVLLAIGLVALSLRYFIEKRRKKVAITRHLEQISGQTTTIKQEKKQSIFEKAKELVLHELPSPDQGYEKLQGYIESALKQGKSHDEVKKILLAKGWLEEVLESYLKRLK